MSPISTGNLAASAAYALFPDELGKDQAVPFQHISGAADTIKAQSHQLIVDSLRDALYQMLETREVSEIKVVDLIKVAGISRGAFYRHYYLITDVLTDDIQTITTDVQKAMGADIGMNWDIILQTVYRHKKKSRFF